MSIASPGEFAIKRRRDEFLLSSLGKSVHLQSLSGGEFLEIRELGTLKERFVAMATFMIVDEPGMGIMTKAYAQELLESDAAVIGELYEVMSAFALNVNFKSTKKNSSDPQTGSQR